MKRSAFILMAVFLLTTGFSGVASAKVNEVVLDDQWQFTTGDSAAFASVGLVDSAWKAISSAKCWEDQGYPGYDGYGWYRKQFALPGNLKELVEKYGFLMVQYVKASDADEFYFNGQKIGTTGSMPPAYVSANGKKRVYMVPAKYVNWDKPNLMAVRVFDGGGGGGLMTPNTLVRCLDITDGIHFTYSFPANEWVFAEGEKQQLNINLKNTLNESVRFNVVLILTTDMFAPVDSIVKNFELDPGDSIAAHIPFKLPAPGFYHCMMYIKKGGILGSPEKFNIGYEPEKVVSPLDAKPDLKEFWDNTRKELDKVAPDYKLTLLNDRSTGAKNVYLVEMRSYGNVKIEGYYAVPKAPGKYPAIVNYMGYGSEPWYPDTNADPGFACFVLSVRGQGIQKATNTYGDWIVWGLDSKENYYYRGAFMDLIRAIDFLSSRPEVDANKIVAEGGSQGGAFTLAACAFDHRLKAGAPSIPFLSDYPDYFRLVDWPRSSFDAYLKANPTRTWKDVYDLLTYFDVKNLAPWIQCPIYMAAGLQDGTCPNHINFAAYNQLKTEKHYHIYHDQGHGTPPEWHDQYMGFFREKLGVK